MNSGQLEKTGSLRKRTLSRGMSEDESLRHIIREAEESSRHLSRSDSRYGSLKRGQGLESHSEDDLLSENIDMMELRANYEDCVQELRALEIQQEALLFQVDCLQDALEGTEEMLAESQRERQHLAAELERERDTRRKMEDSLAALTQEMERLREERRADALRSTHTGPVSRQEAAEGSSVDRDETLTHSDTGLLLQFKHMLFHGQKHAAPAGDDNDESSGYEDAPSEFSPSPSTPDEQPEGATLDTEAEEGGDGTGIPKNGDTCALC